MIAKLIVWGREPRAGAGPPGRGAARHAHRRPAHTNVAFLRRVVGIPTPSRTADLDTALIERERHGTVRASRRWRPSWLAAGVVARMCWPKRPQLEGARPVVAARWLASARRCPPPARTWTSQGQPLPVAVMQRLHDGATTLSDRRAALDPDQRARSAVRVMTASIVAVVSARQAPRASAAARHSAPC